MSYYSRGQGREGRRGSKNESKVVLSFEYLDIKQGQSFKQWEENGDSLKLLELGYRLNKLTVSRALAKKLIIQYTVTDDKKWNANNMPKSSKWKYPNTLLSVRLDVPWSKIELGRKLRVIGYLEHHIFYVIFLDGNHEFYPTKA